MIYTMEDYNQFLHSNVEYKLPEIEANIIKNLIKELGVAFVQEKDTLTDEKNKYKRLPKKQLHKRMEDSWEKTKPFLATKIEKKEGFEKTLTDVRGCFNKLSNKNYEAQSDIIMQHITALQNDKDNENSNENDNANENINKIIKALFDTAGTNKFYSDIYAILYKEICERFPQIANLHETLIARYMESLTEIEYIDSNIDYDKYCDNNKTNDKRKGTATFIVNLMKKNIVEKIKITEIILKMQEYIFTYVDEPNNIYNVEEITENIYTLITGIGSELEQEPNWKLIMENVTLFSQMKVKEHTSLSSRTIFKYMDILDNLQTE